MTFESPLLIFKFANTKTNATDAASVAGDVYETIYAPSFAELKTKPVYFSNNSLTAAAKTTKIKNIKKPLPALKFFPASYFFMHAPKQ